MDTVEELRQDLLEMRELEKNSTRPKVKALLLSNVSQLENLLARAQVSAGETKPLAPSVSTTKAAIPRAALHNYAWDQSEKFVKIYVTIAGNKLNNDQVTATFNAQSAKLLVQNFEGKDHEFLMEGLLTDIDPDKSYYKVKSDSILLMLKKGKEGEEWPAITKRERIVQMKKEEKTRAAMQSPKAGGDPQAGLMQMMKTMYDDGDDETKRSIKKAWQESQDKKAAAKAAKAAAAAGSPPAEA